jgi:hypothetical protein
MDAGVGSAIGRQALADPRRADVAAMASSWFRGAGTPDVEEHAPL